jgi:hypothetical protein
VFRGEAYRHPHCRGYFAETYMRFGLLIRTSPWKDGNCQKPKNFSRSASS